MSFAVILLCLQACLVQNVFGQLGWCGDASGLWNGPRGELFGPYGLAGSYGYAGLNFAGPFAGELATGPVGPYGGAGVGEVAVAGELPAGGATALVGQVPIVGAVEFGGPVRAAGTITITGTCACGCGGPYIY